MAINQKSHAYGASKSSIREIAAYGAARKAQIGAENVFDFSLGNPSVPAPDCVRASIEASIALPPAQIHGYTPASGLPWVRERLADSLCRRFGDDAATAADLYLTCGAAASISISLHAVTNPGDGYDSSVDYAALAGTTITVAASPTPHAEILAVAKDILAAKDITLDIKEFTDYVQPNSVVESGEIFANYFQHVPYLDDFNAQNGTHIVSVAGIHVEPMGLYGGKQTSLDAITAE